MHLPAWSSLPNTHYRVAAKWIMFDEQGRLLLCKSTNSWTLPWWGIDHNEEAIIALQREIIEEMSCSCRIHSQPLTTRQKLRRNGIYYFFIGYALQISLQNFKPSDECVEYKFFSYEEIQQIQTNLEHNFMQQFSYIAQLYHQIYYSYS